ncbi:NAD-dependent epimerase/dehydratase family protein [candidate division WS5 bacterium]|uniref:NAD-dependent epimerase/dehydratase family protein n=1 Tax=candidate division WS5 bacterium TaxID=2093353 RepID=A0A419DFA4_9BACT|nr:MAG: NAD-dependent epimerase/dehydratase family protein [candidate division WS5 bacterium]
MSYFVTNIYQFLQAFVVKNRRVVLIFTHVIHITLAYYLSFVIRFEAVISVEYLNMMLSYFPIILLIRLVLFSQAGLYKDMWGYSSIGDMIKVLRSISVGSVIFLIVVRYFIGNMEFPISIYILEWLLLIIISGGNRLSIRVLREYLHASSSGKRILIVGAGDAGDIIVRDIKSNRKSSYEPIGFIDEDIHKKGLRIHGVPIFGPIDSIQEVIEKQKPEEVLIALSSMDNNNIRRIYELCKPYNIGIKKLPELNEILEGNFAITKKLGQHLVQANLVTEEKVQEALSLQRKEGGRLGSKLIKLGYISEEKLVSFLNKQFGISHMKPISLEDLLQREPVQTNIQSIKKFIENKSVMVTGAGGSIGSELCRQIMKYNPYNLILFERYENNLFEIDKELSEYRKNANNGDTNIIITPVIGDITDVISLEYVFSRFRPQIIFHAAAHKHVPLMEYNPIEAVKNNIIGTKNIIDFASKYNVDNFVMISTDKAVNPTSVMGATKRVAEFLTTTKNSSSDTKFTTVRFGNVLGSNGSVIPTFKQQIKNGGPITVTHPEIKRFFMLIPEAVQLVLLAASSGNGGEIFVLDMGDPIKIGALAENLIRLSGFIPDKEIKIKYTGLRPGEKLYEELFDKTETTISTVHNKFKMAIPEIPSYNVLIKYVSELESIVQNNELEKIIPTIKKIVPNFQHEEIFNVDYRMIM